MLLRPHSKHKMFLFCYTTTHHFCRKLSLIDCFCSTQGKTFAFWKVKVLVFLVKISNYDRKSHFSCCNLDISYCSKLKVACLSRLDKMKGCTCRHASVSVRVAEPPSLSARALVRGVARLTELRAALLRLHGAQRFVCTSQTHEDGWSCHTAIT